MPQRLQGDQTLCDDSLLRDSQMKSLGAISGHAEVHVLLVEDPIRSFTHNHSLNSKLTPEPRSSSLTADYTTRTHSRNAPNESLAQPYSFLALPTHCSHLIFPDVPSHRSLRTHARSPRSHTSPLTNRTLAAVLQPHSSS